MAITVKENSAGGKTYRNINMSDLDYGTSCTLKILYDAPRTMPGKFTNDRGETPEAIVYKVLLMEPDLGEVSFFCRPHLHRDLATYKTGDVVKLTPKEVKREFKGPDGKPKKVSYKGFDVVRVALRMSEEDKNKIVEAVKSIGGVPDRETIMELLHGDGFTDPADLEDVMARVS